MSIFPSIFALLKRENKWDQPNQFAGKITGDMGAGGNIELEVKDNNDEIYLTSAGSLMAWRQSRNNGMHLGGAGGGRPGTGKINASGYVKNGIDIPIQELFKSAEQTLTAGGTYTLAHGLSSAPELFSLSFVCKTANLNYSVNDEVFINPAADSTATSRAISIRANATNILIKMGSSLPNLPDLSSGNYNSITAGSWRMIVRAYAT